MFFLFPTFCLRLPLVFEQCRFVASRFGTIHSLLLVGRSFNSRRTPPLIYARHGSGDDNTHARVRLCVYDGCVRRWREGERKAWLRSNGNAAVGRELTAN